MTTGGTPPALDDIVDRLRTTTEQMANQCSVDMILWDRHSNACLEAADEIERLRRASGTEAALQDMEARKDAAYLERNQVVAALASAFPSGIARTAIEGWSDDWHGCVYIDLPTGQASWHYHDSHAHLFAHLPAYHGTWDGHTTEEKYARLAALSPHAKE